MLWRQWQFQFLLHTVGAAAATVGNSSCCRPLACILPLPFHPPSCSPAASCRYLKDDPGLAAKRSRPSYEGTSYPGGYPAPAPPPAPYGSAPPPYGAPPGAGAPLGGAAPVGVVAPMQPRGYAPITNTKDNPPCNTLFIGNLGDSVSEAEMRGLFRWVLGVAVCLVCWGVF